MASLFTSDTHYGHTNILKYTHRGVVKGGPFATITDMNEQFIKNWNAVVRPDDQVYHMGDFAFLPSEYAIQIARRLNGKKFLVFGNHDRKLRKDPAFLKFFIWARDFAEIKINDQDITLCHYAMRVWNKSHHGAWQLFGHSHGTIPDDPGSLSLDVGVDCWDYTPVSLDQITKRMKAKTFVPIDRHGRD